MAPMAAMTHHASTAQGRVRSQLGETSAQRMRMNRAMTTTLMTEVATMSWVADMSCELVKSFHTKFMTAPPASCMPIKIRR